MSLLLNSERSLAASRISSPLKLVTNWMIELRRKNARHANLLSLLEMEGHRLSDLGLTRQEIHSSLTTGRMLRRNSVD